MEAKMKVSLLSCTQDAEKVVAAAAKLCYSQLSADELMENLTEENTRKFLDMLAGLGHCYDDQTEVLTSSGFKFFKDITREDKVAIIKSPGLQFLGFEYPSNVIKQDVALDKLIHFDNGEIDLLVTDEHRMLTGTRKPSGSYINHVELAKDCIHTKFYMHKTAYQKERDPDLDEINCQAYLIGLFIGCGKAHKNNKNRLIFDIPSKDRLELLSEICDKLDIELQHTTANRYYMIYPKIGKEFAEKYLTRVHRRIVKTLPSEEVLSYNPVQYRSFIKGLRDSRGNLRGEHWSFTSENKALIDLIQAMGSINNEVFDVQPDSKDGYYTLIRDNKRKSVVFNAIKPYEQVTREYYSGKVYCVTVSTGFLLVRRNGKTAICGNCSPIEHASFTFAIEGVSRSLTHQLVRHRIASYSQRSQRYVKEGSFDYVIPKEIKNCKEAEELFLAAMEKDQQFYDDITNILLLKYIKESNLLDNDYDNSCNPIDYAKEKNKKLYLQLEKKAIENARAVLPNACETKIVVTMNARTLLHFISERACSRAQDEIRELANAMAKILKETCPTLFKYAGPPCVYGVCPEGKMSCGKASEMKRIYKGEE